MSVRQKLENLRAGEVIDFPVSSMDYIRNATTRYNSVHFQDGNKVVTNIVRTEGVIRVRRVS